MHPLTEIPSAPRTSLDTRKLVRALAAAAAAIAVAGIFLAAVAYLASRPIAEPDRPAAINAAAVGGPTDGS
jgi:hypothetical protein